MWSRNKTSVSDLSNKAVAVLENHSRRSNIKLTEEAACARCHGMVVATLGALRKETSGGVATARVLFDGTNRIVVNKRIPIRDQGRASIAADLLQIY